MIKKYGYVYMYDRFAGIVEQTDSGYVFTYDPEYLLASDPVAVSKTLPLRKESYESKILFPFFDGLIPEGWLLDIAWKSWKIDSRDRMELLLSCCSDTIGAVSVRREKND